MVALVLPETFVPSIKTLRESFSVGDFVLESLFCDQNFVDFKSSVPRRDLAMGLMV